MAGGVPSSVRLRASLRRHLKHGFVNAVFREPGEDGAEQTIPGPGAGVEVDQATVDEFVAQALALARDGYVKQTWVLDPTVRVLIDGRYGAAKVVVLDEARATKVMGGKQRPIRPDHDADLLRVIGIMNADGTISAKHAKKYKQVNHFVELCRPIWQGVRGQGPLAAGEPLRVLDLGCGNGYLTFVIAHALRAEGIAAHILGVDARDDVVTRAHERADALGWTELAFVTGSIAQAEQLALARLGGPPDMVVALHACDTASDDALALAIESNAQAILVAPCCQHELATQLHGNAVAQLSPALAQFGLLKADFAAVLTDALRVEVVQAAGYHTDVVEFVDDRHTPKNAMIRAIRRPDAVSRDKLTPLYERVRRLQLRPHLLERLRAWATG